MKQLEKLRDRLRGFKKTAIAYSGGVDSNFLMAIARETLGREHTMAVLCNGAMMAEDDFAEAVTLLEHMDVRYVVLEMDVFAVPEFVSNDKRRCYFCKKNLMSRILEEARKEGFPYVLDGKNLDDGKVYRPGAMAAEELGIRSPLFECGFSKQDIRDYSEKLGIPTWNKPSNACLASRFPYGTHLTPEELKRAEHGEKCLKELGILNGRVRVHGSIARIEVAKTDFEKLLLHPDFTGKVKACGFEFVTLDLEGFRSGSFDS